ncbi:MAG TPA: 6-phosphogluconolactonase [Steroidobacteraceae bacterium]|jgi:6-phosphogluconolactonase|nr:6-phosphogluconolactonase [Steroidobacteraceae bacterium]
MAKPDTQLRRFANTDALNEALAAEITASLDHRLRAGRSASLTVAGGRSPVALFEQLSVMALEWGRVWVTLTDERWVRTSSNDSNERLVREHLLRNAAAKANFVGLKTAAPDPNTGAAASWAAIEKLPRPFDQVLLGMGDDGHIASLFPDSPALAVALDPTLPPGCVGMIAPVAPHARLSLNLSALLDARHIALLIIGSGKWVTYEHACADGPIAQMPVRALLRQQRVPLSVYWAP